MICHLTTAHKSLIPTRASGGAASGRDSPFRQVRRPVSRMVAVQGRRCSVIGSGARMCELGVSMWLRGRYLHPRRVFMGLCFASLMSDELVDFEGQ